jgi:hypothetical protein
MAGPSTALRSVGMTPLFGCWSLLRGIREGPGAHGRSLHCATLDRDDTSVWVLEFVMGNSGGPWGARQVPPLRYARSG